MRLLSLDTYSRKLYQTQERTLEGLKERCFIKEVKVDYAQQHMHFLFLARGGHYVRKLYSLTSFDLMGTWDFPFDDQYISFCLDGEGSDVKVIYFKWTPSNSSFLERVKGASNESLQVESYKGVGQGLVILFESNNRGILYLMKRADRHQASTFIECLDATTLQHRMNIEIPFPVHSAMFVEDYFFLRAMRDDSLYKYDTVHEKGTIHCQNFPFWDSSDGALIAWRDFLVLIVYETLYLFK